MEAWSLVRDPSYIRTDKLDARNSDSRLSTFSNALNESNPKTVAWLVTWKLISIGNPLPPPRNSFRNFRPTFSSNFSTETRFTDRSSFPPPQVSIVDATTLSIFQATPFTDHHFTTSSKSYGFYRPAFNLSRITERSFTRDPFNPILSFTYLSILLLLRLDK